MFCLRLCICPSTAPFFSPSPRLDAVLLHLSAWAQMNDYAVLVCVCTFMGANPRCFHLLTELQEKYVTQMLSQGLPASSSQSPSSSPDLYTRHAYRRRSLVLIKLEWVSFTLSSLYVFRYLSFIVRSYNNYCLIKTTIKQWLSNRLVHCRPGSHSGCRTNIYIHVWLCVYVKIQHVLYRK